MLFRSRGGTSWGTLPSQRSRTEQSSSLRDVSWTQPSLQHCSSSLITSSPPFRIHVFPRNQTHWRESKHPHRTQTVFLRSMAPVHRLREATSIVRPRLNLPTTRSTPPHGSAPGCISMAAEELENSRGPASRGECFVKMRWTGREQ